MCWSGSFKLQATRHPTQMSQKKQTKNCISLQDQRRRCLALPNEGRTTSPKAPGTETRASLLPGLSRSPFASLVCVSLLLCVIVSHVLLVPKGLHLLEHSLWKPQLRQHKGGKNDYLSMASCTESLSLLLDTSPPVGPVSVVSG